MAAYEVIREIKNMCRNSQMRDVTIEEVDCEDPEQYVRSILRGREVTLTVDRTDRTVTVYADCDGLVSRFVFTEL